MTTIRQIFDNDLTLICDKWEPYFDVYETFFSKFKNTSPTFVEVGVYHGGSIEMWTKYFDTNAKIYGVDISPLVDKVDGATIVLGDQNDREFWKNFLDQTGEIDIFLDDGSHVMEHQITTFMSVWPKIKNGGVYMCEDTHTSYWKNKYNGGFKKPGSFIEFCKDLIDGLHAEHLRKGSKVNAEILELVRDIRFISFFNSQIVMVKSPKSEFKRIYANR
jgi:hypothetical protein